MITLEIN